MDALAGYGSDDSSSDTTPPNALSSLVEYDDDDDDDDDDTPQQSPKCQSNNASITALPVPLLGNECMIQRPEDHFSSLYGTQIAKTKVPLQQINKDWIVTLKSKREFHNPAFFHRMVEHFGIQDPMGTNTGQEKLHDYEYDLARLEEEVRMRQQQQTNDVAATTAFAQQQVERAMQQNASYHQ